MNEANLVRTLEQFAATSPDTRAGIDAIFAFTKVLESEPEFAGTGRMVPRGKGWGSFSAQSAAQHMLNIARAARELARDSRTEIYAVALEARCRVQPECDRTLKASGRCGTNCRTASPKRRPDGSRARRPTVVNSVDGHRQRFLC
jgi:hypothetical protein